MINCAYTQMTKTEQLLKKELKKLNLNIQSKIELWLTYKGLKPASFVSIKLGKRNNYNDISKDVQALKHWLTGAQLFTIQDPTQKESFWISPDQDKVKKLSKIMWKEDRESVYEKGILFGYPRKAVKLYSDHIESIDQGRKTFEQVGLGLIAGGDSGLLTHSLEPYIRYVIRRNYVNEDTQVALEWAKLCRKEIPSIAQQFEKELNSSYNNN